MKKLIGLAVLFTVPLASCSAPSEQPRVYATPEGVYFTDWKGTIYQVQGRRLYELAIAKGDLEAKTFTIASTIPAVDGFDGYPVAVQGTAKFDRGHMKLRISLSLAPTLAGVKPQAAQQTEFADALANGRTRLKSLNIAFLDADGFAAAPDKSLPIPSDKWNRVVDDKGRAYQYRWAAKEPMETAIAQEISSVEVGWSAIP